MKLLHNTPGYGAVGRSLKQSLITFIDDNYTKMWNTKLNNLANLKRLDPGDFYASRYPLQDLPILAEGFTTIDELRQIVPELFI